MKTKATERIASSRIVRVVMSMALALSVCMSPATALAVGEDAGSWSLNIRSYNIAGGIDSVNGGVGYVSEDGNVSYCYDWESHGPGSEGQEYTHMKRGSHATDYVVAKGYPNHTTIEGYSLSKAEAQTATQLAAWLVSGTMSVDMDDRYGAAPSDVRKAARALAAAAEAYQGGDDRIDNMSSILFVDGKREVQAMLTGNMFGHISLKKVSSNTDITGGNSLYDLDGVEYGVFTDKGCTDSYHGYKLTMDEAHNASLDLVPGTYYVKEVTAPADGTYVLDQTVYTVKVKSGQTTKVNGGEVSDTPQSNPLEIVIVKHDCETQAADPQGDATLAGAEFTVNYFDNDSGSTSDHPTRTFVLKTGDDGRALLDEAHLVSGKLYKNSQGKPTLPVGTYSIQETKAPEGYLLNDEIHVMQVKDTDGRDGTSETVKSFVQVSNLKLDGEGNPLTDDDVIRGGVQVVKNDLELQRSEALGGNSHDALTTGTTLSGIEFTITNASEHKVRVDERWFEPGEVVRVITTSWNKDAEAYTAQTSDDCLPYGTYAIQETKTNDSYLLTDGEARTFQVREEGAIVKADADGGSLDFFDQVVRNDLKVSKKADSDNASLMVPFVLTNVSTGEAHVLVTDRNGQASTESSWNKHSSNTNGNDSLMEAETITADMIDSKAGVWFFLGEDGSKAAVDDSLAALPYGEYALTELRCDANEGMELVSKKVWVERDSTVAEPIWMTIDDKDGPKIQTEETDKADGDHYAQAAEQVTLVDTVYYENLKPGTEYTMTGTLMVKSTGKALTDSDGNEITASKTFTPKSKTGEVELEFTFDGSLLAGEDIVAFESLVSDGIEVAAHADIDDEGQTVRILGIHTTATDKADGDKLVTGSEVVISDEVAYEGLTAGQEYTLTATLMDAETGEAVMDGEGLFAKAVTASVTFTPEEADGIQVVDLSMDSKDLGGHKLVVFEKLSLDGKQVASHEDPSDEGQTVTVVEIGTTLVDASDGDHVIVSGKVKLTDTIEYKGLVPGETYTAHGTLIVKSTGMPLEDADGKPVTATAEFTPDKADGTAEVTFEFDASKIEEGVELVAFEECLDVNGNVVAVHQDIDDEGQTVVVDNPETPEVPDEPGKGYDKTGVDTTVLFAAVIVLIAAGAAFGIYAIRKRKQATVESDEDDDSENNES